MIDIFPTIPTNIGTHQRYLPSYSVHYSPSSERDQKSRSIHNTIWTHDESDMSHVPAASTQPVLAVSPETIEQHEPAA